MSLYVEFVEEWSMQTGMTDRGSYRLYMLGASPVHNIIYISFSTLKCISIDSSCQAFNRAIVFYFLWNTLYSVEVPDKNEEKILSAMSELKMPVMFITSSGSIL